MPLHTRVAFDHMKLPGNWSIQLPCDILPPRLSAEFLSDRGRPVRLLLRCRSRLQIAVQELYDIVAPDLGPLLAEHPVPQGHQFLLAPDRTGRTVDDQPVGNVPRLQVPGER